MLPVFNAGEYVFMLHSIFKKIENRPIRSFHQIFKETASGIAVWGDRFLNKAVVFGLTAVFVVNAAAEDNKKYGLTMATYLKRQAACGYFTGKACDEKTLGIVDFKAWKDRLNPFNP